MGKRSRVEGGVETGILDIARKKKRVQENGEETAKPPERSNSSMSNAISNLASKEKEHKSKSEKKRKAKRVGDADAENTGTNEDSNAHSAAYEQAETLTQTGDCEIDSFLKSNFIAISGTGSKDLRPILKFEHLPVDCKHGSMFKSFSSPTPVQAATWPFLLSGRDVVGVAETGSGKTLAFGVPCVRHVRAKSAKSKKGAKIRALVVSPTRELALQIHEQMEKLVAGTEIKVVCVYGGVPKPEQRSALASSHIVIATPGRLMDFIQEGAADLSRVSFLVLDEADRMLDKGFEQDIRTIVGSVPAQQAQTAMFTATWPPSIRELADEFFKNPIKITIGDNPEGDLRANVRVAQQVEVLDPRGKEARLLQLLKQHQSGKRKNDRILVFCLYKKEAARIENFIRMRGFNVAGIHGDMTQSARTQSLDGFRDGSVPVLVATDVAARGLDIPAVKVVINVTFPLTAEDYVHRIGRTGRAGKEGLAITFFTEHDKGLSGALINVLRAAKQPVPEELLKFGGTVKKKSHDAYGAFYKDTAGSKQATKITFD